MSGSGHHHDHDKPHHHGHGSGAPAEHRAYAPKVVACGVLTVSDTRTRETDASGKLIEEKLLEAGHRVAEREIVRDEADAIRSAVLHFARRSEIEAVIVTGGTGVSARDVTPDTLMPLFDKQLSGFGELFRALSFEEIGAAAVLSRAVAGTIGGSVVYVTPGSSGAVKTAMDQLILPELAHIVGQLRRR
ncbi:MAG: MogA/MoaB family molybdenum cofactor biosynthesis protein [bacterium]|nr:MogA/MoaB family molybdenum cofactor biosynthesis protein [bacterium]